MNVRVRYVFCARGFCRLGLRIYSKDSKFLDGKLTKMTNSKSGKQQKEPQRRLPTSNFPDVSNVKFETLAQPTKSTRDKKEYKVIRLSNGLTACLISDVGPEDVEDDDYECESDMETSEDSSEEEQSETDEAIGSDDNETKKTSETRQKMAAAALCVGVGSFSDPANIPGMAHFLEHMVFMGSEKFPEENDFDKFISKRGGSDNASTDVETTTFYFECLEKYLYKSLDKFAQFFISPLMKRESINRERESIDSEFQMATPNDGYRKEQLLTSLFNAKVPINQFAWGNLITLKENVSDEELYAQLHTFRKRHYSAHRMTLCVQARMPIETIQSFVLDCFKNVPANNLPPLDFKQYSDVIYDNSNFNKLYYVIPNKNSVSVELTWALPSLLHLYKSKPHQYISWLLGDEGKGSLISYLRKKVWALSIYTGNGETGSEHNTMYAYFTVTLDLTKAGLENLYEVINLMFAYLNLLRNVGPQERIFKEMKTIDDTSFEFADEMAAVEMVEEVAENMQFYPSEDYLTGGELFFEFDPDAIRMVLNYLRPDKMNVMVLNKDMPEDIKCDLVEPWFKTHYTVRDIPNAWLEKWTNAKPVPEFSLPQPNKFLTTDFDILPNIKNNPDYPSKIACSEVLELWYRKDQIFDTPTAFYYYLLITPLILETPVNSCMVDMLIELLAIELTEDAYPAQVAGLDYSISSEDKGIVIRMKGFNEKLPILVSVISGHLKKLAENMTQGMFDAVKESLGMLYYNKFLKPSNLSKDVRLSLLLSTYWPPIEKHAALKTVTFDMMKSFAECFNRHLYVHALVQGNVDKKTALDTTNKFVAHLDCQPLLDNTYPKIRVVELPKNKHCIRCWSFNKNDTNSYITNYYQTGPFNMKIHCLIELLMMIIEEPLFDVLRTKEQLGYHVYCTLRDTFGILGYSITVNTQAAKFTTHQIDQRIEAFVKHVQKLLKKMPEKKFSQFKRDLIKIKELQDVILKEEVSRNWGEIVTREYIFDRTKQEIKQIDELKFGDVRKFWDEHTVQNAKSSANIRKLSVQVVGCTSPKQCEEDQHQSGEPKVSNAEDSSKVYQLNLIGVQKDWNEKQSDAYFIRNIGEFKHNLFLYPSKSSLV